LCTGVYIKSLMAIAAASWTSSSSSSLSIGPFTPCGGLLDESYDDNEVFLLDDKEKCTFEKGCEATDALDRIGGMLLDAVQILRDCHK